MAEAGEQKKETDKKDIQPPLAVMPKEGAGARFKQLVFDDLRESSAGEAGPMVIDSYCVNCEGQGQTRLLLTRIPLFKDVLIASFSCEHCGYANNEIDYTGVFEPTGKKITFKVHSLSQMNRQVILGDCASYQIPELEFEAPQNPTRRGVLTTVEGLLEKTIAGLAQDQARRHVEAPEVAAAIDKFIERLRGLQQVAEPFTLLIDDPAGNSFVDNPFAPKPDPDATTTTYCRTREQCDMLGLQFGVEDDPAPAAAAASDPGAAAAAATAVPAGGAESGEAGAGGAVAAAAGSVAAAVAAAVAAVDLGAGEIEKDEILHISSTCPNCMAEVQCQIKPINIPYFKDVMIYATACDRCGMRSNEVRSGGAIEKLGVRYTLALNGDSDWKSRDVLKSPQCALIIPEIELECTPSTLGGSFTTVEGLLQQIFDQLSANPFMHSEDSATASQRSMQKFLLQLQSVIDCEIPATLVLEDPTGNSYVQDLYAPDADPYLVKSSFERTDEQNEDLGLNDLHTEDY